MYLENLIDKIKPLDFQAMEKAREYQLSLAKPPGSLGRLEDFAVQLSGITGKLHNEINKKCVLVFASDNGVVSEGVACAPQYVTLMQTINLTRAKTGASVLARQFGCDIVVCDVGVNADIENSKVLNRKIARGTKNIRIEPAMTRDECLKAISIGAELAVSQDADVIGIGEMGIGNTTTSSAVLSVLLGVPADVVTGRGGGLTDSAFEIKKKVIADAITVNRPDKNDVVDVLSKVGGFDIAAMCGAFLGAAYAGKPVVIDGFISVVAALAAYKLCPLSVGYFIPSHESFEIGYKLAIKEMKLEPIFRLGMRLGEGSGCPLTFEVLKAATVIMNNMATFEQAEIDDKYLKDIREGDKFSVD